jgi:tight adherence protein B
VNMQLAVVTFVLVVGIVYGLYWLFVERAESEEQDALRKRLKKTPKARVTAALLKQPDRLSDVGILDGLLGSAGRLVDPLQRTITQSGVKANVSSIILGSGCLAGLAYIAIDRFLHLPLVGIGFAVGAAFIPYGLLRFMRNRRMIQFEEQFPEAIDLLARALRAGHALTTGLSMVAEEMRAPVGPEFKRLFDEQNFGMPLPQALKAFAERIPTLDAKFFVTAVLTQREAGGNLSEVLDNLSSIIRDRFRVKRQVRVISAHGRITGWILSALPVSLGLFFAFTSGDTYSKFYTDPLGIRMIVGALVLQVIGVFIIRRIVRIEY